MKGFLKKGDIIVVLAVLALSLTLFALRFFSPSASYALVYENGKVIHKIDLQNAERIEVEINGGRLLKEKGRIRYISSDCPDKVCEKTGWLEKVGDTAACIPNRTVVTVTGRVETDFDVMTY